MLKTSIFVSAASEDVKADVVELMDFFRRTNDRYFDRGHYFSLLLSEDIDRDASLDVADCALAFFLAGPVESAPFSEGMGLPDTYQAALNSYNKTGKPKISVYIKNPGTEKPSPAPSIDYSLISNNYSHIDTLKLDILMQIKRLGLDGVDIHLEDGKAWQGNTVLLSLENVEAVSGYENLQNLKQKRAELESRYIEAKARYAENPDDPEAYETYTLASGQRFEAIGEIRNIEDQLFSLMEGMYARTAKGNLSRRQEEAYRLVERGHLKEARDVLDFYSIVSDSRHNEEHAELLSQRAQVYVNEQLQLKDINAALLDWEGVDECYKEAARLEEKHNLPRNASVLYVEYLYYQNRHNEAIEIGEKIRRQYESPRSGVPDEEKSLLYNFLGIVFSDTNRMDEAEEMLKASLEIRLRRTDGSLEWREREVAGSYNGLGNLYYMQNRFAEAEEAHKKALEIRKKWTEVDPDAVEPSLAWTYVNLGAVYNENDEKTGEAIEIVSAALDIFKKLAVNKPEPNELYMTQCYAHLGVSYTKLQRFDEAEAEFDNALRLLLKLVSDNPDAYESREAETYIDFADSLYRAKRYQESLEKYNAALELYKKLSKHSPDAFEPSSARCHAGLAELYIVIQRFADAETALNTAIKIYDKYADANPAYAASADEARKALADLNAKQLRNGGENPRGGEAPELTPQEQEIALLLTDGESKSEIARKLHMSAGDVERATKAIRDKVAGIVETDPVIASIVKEYKLTRRETDVLRYLQNGYGTDTIASELLLAEETVRVHVRNLLKKLSINDRQKVPRWLASYESHMN